MTLSERAAAFAKRAHAGQTDRGGHDYFKHLEAVALGAPRRYERFVDELSDSEYETIVAAGYLHDAIEDTEITYADIEFEFGKRVADIVWLVTKESHLSQDEYFEKVMTDRMAMCVKLADLTHNSDLTRLRRVTPKDIERSLVYKIRAVQLRTELKG